MPSTVRLILSRIITVILSKHLESTENIGGNEMRKYFDSARILFKESTVLLWKVVVMCDFIKYKFIVAVVSECPPWIAIDLTENRYLYLSFPSAELTEA